MFPKILHYVWVGPHAMPEEQASWVRGWREMMPDWSVRHWGNGDIDWAVPFVRQAASVSAWNRISDWLRMHALATVGGIYLDTDVELIKPLDPLVGDGSCAFLGAQETDSESDNLFNGGVIGSPRGHWLPLEARARLEQLDARDDLDCYTGPGVVTELLRGHGIGAYPSEPSEIAGVRIYPVDYFYPYGWTERFDPACITANTYAVHHWAHSWNPAHGSRAARTGRALANLLARAAPPLSVRLIQRKLAKARG